MAAMVEGKLLLADENPIEYSSSRDLVSRLRYTTPERLRHKLAGDLDNIVLKAMLQRAAASISFRR